ncbi:MAG: phosphoribosylaminoimidazolesuccinocarboxamide synthase [Alphaproteobacteria bacterium]|nr:phosphoribosylaminoimidazolesuccinocarboxamide synthase [Alphaproteobacteria bacterium]
MKRGELLYEGKSKAVFATDDANRVIVRFKDDATAFNGVKKASIEGKGHINCAISAHLFELCAEQGIDHHMVERLSDTEMLCEKVEIVPVEVIVRNVVAGSFAKRYGLDEGEMLAFPLIEWFYKSDALNDPLMGEDVAVVLGWAKKWELAFMRESALEVNQVLLDFYAAHGIDLVDMKLEYGRTADGRLILADELTPDGSRLWDSETGQKLDKDVFRRDLADLGATYRELYERVMG